MTTIVTANGEATLVEPTELLGSLIKRAHKAANHMLRRILEPLGLTPMQAAALSRLLERDGLSLNELAERLHTDAPTLSGVVDCLVTAGYVERREDRQDRRRLRLFATEQAWGIQGALANAEARREAALTRGLSTDDVAKLKALLQRVSEAVGEPAAAEV
jgi:DNA-binding MarR family transcriptional regulator